MPEKFKFTQASIKALKPPIDSKQTEVWDLEQTGFGVRLGASGSKTFFTSSRVNGRQIRATVGKFPALNVEDARKKARRMLVEMYDGVNPNDARRERSADKLELEKVFEVFLSTRKNLSERTIETYRGAFDRHLSAWKSRSVISITKQMVIDRHKVVGETRGKNVANQAIRVLRVVLNFSRSAYGFPAVNPVAIMSEVQAWYKDGVRSNVIGKGVMPDFFKEVLTLSETSRDYILLLLFTGLRRDEGMGLRWENIDFAEEMLTVIRKGGEPHSLPMPVYLTFLLSERKTRWGGDGFVFPSWSKSGHITHMHHSLEHLRKKGVNFTFHDLRRTFITTAESLDISAYAVKRLADHKQTDVTGKHYVVHDIDRLREPMERIAQALLKSGAQI